MSVVNRKQENLQKKQKLKEGLTSYQQRNCTDVFCVIVGVAFSLFMILISLIGYNSYHYIQSNFPADSDGLLCGVDVQGYSYLYFSNPPEMAKRLCVSKCPEPGDKKLDCNPTRTLGCRFTQTPGFQVTYYDSEAVQTRNGFFCYPKDEQEKYKLIQSTNLLHRDNFMRSLDAVLICISIALAASIIYMVFVQFLPIQMNYVTVDAGIIGMVILVICCLFYPTVYMTAKWIYIAIFLFLVLITVLKLFLRLNAWKFHGIFLKEATKMVSNRWYVLLYVPLFLVIAFAFVILLLFEFKSIWTQGHVEFKAQQSLYYILKGFWPNFTTVLWAIQAIWGMSFIKQSFNFCISGTAVLWYHYQNTQIQISHLRDFSQSINCQKEQGFLYPLKLLVMKHLGSVIGGSFMSGFLSIGNHVLDFLRPDNQETPNNSYTKFFQNACDSCFKVFQLARSDALAYVNLTGVSYCNSVRYCEYLCDQSLLMDNAKSISNPYRISAHFLIAAFVSIIGLYSKGTGISINTIGIIMILTIFFSSFFIGLHSDAAQAIQIAFLQHQQFTKRLSTKFHPFNLQQFNINNKSQLVNQLKDMRKIQMQIE